MSIPNIALRRFHETRNSLSVVLNTLARVAAERGEMVTQVHPTSAEQESEPRSLSDVLKERAENVQKKHVFRLAVVGEFNAGKSTLINALLGRAVLATARQPSTATITTLRYGEPERFRVTYRPKYRQQYPTITRDSNDLLNDIAEYTSESAHSPDGGIAVIKGEATSLAEIIEEVEVWCNSPFLKEQEIEIIDTPGLGSVYESHKTVTYALIPKVDATLFLFGSDPGITAADVAFLKFLREYVNQMLFIMTKADYTRDARELEDQLRYNLTVLTADVAGIDIKRIYPLSALQALRGEQEKSGLIQLQEALQGFLVRSSGTARLQVPLQVACTNWQYLQELVTRDMDLASQSLEEIVEARKRLEQERQLILDRKRTLLKWSTDTVKDLIQDALDGIDLLPTKTQIAVEKQIDSYGIKDLLKVDQHIPAIIRDQVDAWLAEKEQKFSSKAQLLQERIEQDLRGILDSIESTITVSTTAKRHKVDTPTKKVLVRGILQVAQSTLLGLGLQVAAGFGTAGLVSSIVWGMTTSSVIPYAVTAAAAAPLLALIPLLFLAREAHRKTILAKETLCLNIKNGLRSNLPHNYVNVYQAIVEGFDDQGQFHPGLRQVITQSFNTWGNAIKANVESIVTNNLDSYSYILEKRIADENRGQWNRETELRQLRLQSNELEEVEKRLIEIETIVENLSADSFEHDNPDP